jgi:hypothetical protein
VPGLHPGTLQFLVELQHRDFIAIDAGQRLTGLLFFRHSRPVQPASARRNPASAQDGSPISTTMCEVHQNRFLRNIAKLNKCLLNSM